MALVTSYENFGDVIKKKIDFVDKSLFVKEMLDNIDTQVELITRPRRFGKTFNLSMLHHFLASEVYGQNTQGLFDGLKISKENKKYMEQQGKYPVIFITFKEVKDSSFEVAYKKLCILIQECYEQHYYLLDSPKLHKSGKEYFELAVNGKLKDQATLEVALKNLTYYLYQHYGVKPWILIDEYDTPIQESHIHKYYDEMISVMRGLLGTVLKTNPYLNKAVITGILRIAKESIFSGLNNLSVYSIFDSQYGQYFGFTEDEVSDLLKQYKLEDKFKDIKEWYDGYYIGNVNVYNPWSIVNCIKNNRLKTYWINTGNTTLIKNLLTQADSDITEKFESILQDEPIEALINENMIFPDLYTKKDSIWSLLLFSGYLKASNIEDERTKVRCLLSAPNKEVMAIYQDVVQEWFTENIDESRYNEFLKNLTEGRVNEFAETLKNFLVESMSVFDVKGKSPEKFYHGFIMGLMVNLSKSHIIKSNRESGYGFYDVMIIPKDKSKLGIILEFKVARSDLSLEKEAKTALKQIEERQYEVEMKQNGINNILKLGLAFRGKEVAILQK